MTGGTTDYGESAGRTSADKAVISFAAAANNEIIAAPAAGTKIRILKIYFVCASANTITFKSGTTAISGAMPFGAKNGLALDFDNTPMDMTTAESFVMTASAATQVSGQVLYIVE